MKFIKHHWFNLLIALMIVFGMGFMLLIALSPREDAQKRGFIPCTEQLADSVTDCHGGLACTTKAVLLNSVCDAKVIGRGFKLWWQNQQPRPWSNYLFKPEISHHDSVLYENSELFYQEYPDHLRDFEKVKQEHRKLEESNHYDPNQK